MSDKQRLVIEVACNIAEVLFNSLWKFAFPFSKTESELRIRPWATDGRYIYFGKPTEFHSIDSRMQKLMLRDPAYQKPCRQWTNSRTSLKQTSEILLCSIRKSSKQKLNGKVLVVSWMPSKGLPRWTRNQFARRLSFLPESPFGQNVFSPLHLA